MELGSGAAVASLDRGQPQVRQIGREGERLRAAAEVALAGQLPDPHRDRLLAPPADRRHGLDPELQADLLDLTWGARLEVHSTLEWRTDAEWRGVEPDRAPDPVGLALGGGIKRELGHGHDAGPQERRRLEDHDRDRECRVKAGDVQACLDGPVDPQLRPFEGRGTKPRDRQLERNLARFAGPQRDRAGDGDRHARKVLLTGVCLGSRMTLPVRRRDVIAPLFCPDQGDPGSADLAAPTGGDPKHALDEPTRQEAIRFEFQGQLERARAGGG